LATQDELKLAAKLVHSELVPREAMEQCLRIRDEAERKGKIAELAQILLEKELIHPAELQSMQGILLTETQPIGDYRFLRKIAEGGMAEVYLAQYKPIKAEVALKIMKPELARNERFRLRFLREAKLLMNLDHRNIVKGYEIRRDEGYIFCAMEHVDGATVEERVDEDGPFAERLALYVVREVCAAIAYLNKRGVVHRDLKPGNILLTEAGRVKLIDLGLAKLRSGMTKDSDKGLTVGTVEYLSPEQARGREDVDVRADIYSLGVTLFHIMVGEVPFKGEGAEVIAKQVLQALQRPELKSRQLPAFTHYLIQKMMAKDREDRFQHPDEIVREIEAQFGDVSDAVVGKKVKRPIDLGPKSATLREKKASKASSRSARMRGRGRRAPPGRGRRRR